MIAFALFKINEYWHWLMELLEVRTSNGPWWSSFCWISLKQLMQLIRTFIFQRIQLINWHSIQVTVHSLSKKTVVSVQWVLHQEMQNERQTRKPGNCRKYSDLPFTVIWSSIAWWHPPRIILVKFIDRQKTV